MFNKTCDYGKPHVTETSRYMLGMSLADEKTRQSPVEILGIRAECAYLGRPVPWFPPSLLIGDRCNVVKGGMVESSSAASVRRSFSFAVAAIVGFR